MQWGRFRVLLDDGALGIDFQSAPVTAVGPKPGDEGAKGALDLS